MFKDVITTKDGEVFEGSIRQFDGESYHMRTMSGTEFVVPKADIESIQSERFSLAEDTRVNLED